MSWQCWCTKKKFTESHRDWLTSHRKTWEAVQPSSAELHQNMPVQMSWWRPHRNAGRRYRAIDLISYTALMLILHLEGQPFSILGFTIPESKHSVLCDDKKCKMALRFFTFVTTKARQEWRPKTLLLPPFFLGQDSWDERLAEVSNSLCGTGCHVVSQDVYPSSCLFAWL